MSEEHISIAPNRFQVELEEVTVKFTDLTAQFNTLVVAKETVDQQLVESGVQVSNLETRISMLESENTKIASDLQNARQDLVVQTTASEVRFAECNKMHEDLNAEILAKHDRILELEKTLDATRTGLSDLDSRYNNLTLLYETKSKECTNANELYNATKIQLESCTPDSSHVLNLQAVKTELETALVNNEALKGEITQLEKVVKEKQALLGLKQSIIESQLEELKPIVQGEVAPVVPLVTTGIPRNSRIAQRRR